jgi:hypothetical protein
MCIDATVFLMAFAPEDDLSGNGGMLEVGP